MGGDDLGFEMRMRDGKGKRGSKEGGGGRVHELRNRVMIRCRRNRPARQRLGMDYRDGRESC